MRGCASFLRALGVSQILVLEHCGKEGAQPETASAHLSTSAVVWISWERDTTSDRARLADICKLVMCSGELRGDVDDFGGTSTGTACLPYVFVGDPHYKKMEPIGLPADLAQCDEACMTAAIDGLFKIARMQDHKVPANMKGDAFVSVSLAARGAVARTEERRQQ
eukprot:COSAG01_NODE_18598_length_1065_cov_1.310559_2_plen_165_part_00